MNLELLREQVRAFLLDRLGDPEPATATTGEDICAARAFQRSLFDAGLAGLSWPRESGGQGLPAAAESVYDTQAADFPVPTAPLTLSLRICGPAVVEFGTDEQRARHATATLKGEHVWCQLWSEPEAGSDLAAVRTRAVKTGSGDWIVDGQKIWTSNAHFSDYALLLCRTDPSAPKNKGLSMLIVDMRLPGVTVRPLRQMTGAAEFNVVFLDNVRVPGDAILGEPGQGWPITTWMMGRERLSVTSAMRHPMSLEWAEVRAIAQASGREHDPLVRDRLTELWLQERANRLFATRLSQELAQGSAKPQLGSALKVCEAAVLRAAAETAVLIAGEDAVSWPADDPDSWPADDAGASRIAGAVLASPGFAIGGGTDDIQLNTLGEHVLGLPREPRVPPRP